MIFITRDALDGATFFHWIKKEKSMLIKIKGNLTLEISHEIVAQRKTSIA